MGPENQHSKLLLNLATLAASALLSLVLAELVLFRVFFPGADLPIYDFSESGVVKHLPNQTGTYRIKNEIAAPFRINQNGWNSGHERYLPGKGERLRIAVIGDSYVEALQVPYKSSLAERIEELCGGQCEAYRFGISGAPFSQYWHVLRREAVSYQPDWVVVLLVQNDFDESFLVRERQPKSAFLKLRMEGNRVVGEVEPSPPVVPWYEPLKKLGMYRSLWIRYQLRTALIRPVGMNDPNRPLDFGDRLGALRGAALYVTERMRDLSSQHGIRLLLVMDGDRMAIYNAGNGEPTGAATGLRSLHAMMREVTQEAGVEFLDLHEVLDADYGRNRRAFNFANDYHWNEYAHELVARTVYRYIRATEKEPQTGKRHF